MSDVVQDLWGFCHTLKHDGIDYGDYIEQITYLLFIKMASEKGIPLPADCDWDSLESKTGVELTTSYSAVLQTLGGAPGLLGDIFANALSRFTNPVNLRKLIKLIDDTEWTALDVDVKAAAFEGLLEKAGSEGKKGAGQYFTPRLLIKSIVRCVKPDARTHRDFTVDDPACGTGGFLVCAYEWFVEETKGGALDRSVAARVKAKTYFGQELVPRARRLALMNLYLHQLEPDIKRKDSIYEVPESRKYDVVLTNPPFGVKGQSDVPVRDDFVVSTANKQLNFMQHVITILKPGGRAAVVVPDNVLFADQAADVFRILTEDCDLHTIWRLPNGCFTPYSQGTKTNVLFFTKGRPTEHTWIYDNRTNIPRITKKERPLTQEHFAEFERCYGDDPFGHAPRKENDSLQDRWRRFSISKIREHDYEIEALKWLQEQTTDEDDLPPPEELASDIGSELQLMMDELAEILSSLERSQDRRLDDEQSSVKRA